MRSINISNNLSNKPIQYTYPIKLSKTTIGKSNKINKPICNETPQTLSTVIKHSNINNITDDHPDGPLVTV